ncbi:hypothetical protein PAHAL_9G345400 [Panicum hallii]|uniref:F-box domain-containing protein n=1 Tax=Panicum hallii TaxID=206008 RepID=A0A2T8I3F8_9POAL|nr:hypothetical protein PAHAL_9G345400 [Panicum hallii]
MRRQPRDRNMSKRLGTRSRSPAVDLVPDDLRLPPDPGHLLVASLVCKRWRRLIRNPAFVVRFRAFHRAIPVLGFYQNINGLIRFFPIAAPAPRLSAPQDFQNGMCWVLDCRHGRVLIYDDSYESLFIWDPMAATSSHVGSLPELSGEENFTAVLVCTPGNDDHTDCHSAPFRIELLVSVRVFSSESGAWGDWASISPPSLVSPVSAAVVGGSVYWKLDFVENSNHILGFRMETGELDSIELPTDVQENYMSDILLMPAEYGSIGFVGVNLSSLHFWSRKTDSEGAAGWALIRIMDMEMLPISDRLAGDMLSWSSVVGSKQLKKMPQASASAIYTYTSFYSRDGNVLSLNHNKCQPSNMNWILVTICLSYDYTITISHVATLSVLIEMLSTTPKYQKEKKEAAVQVEAVDKEKAESSSSGHQVHPLLTK